MNRGNFFSPLLSSDKMKGPGILCPLLDSPRCGSIPAISTQRRHTSSPITLTIRTFFKANMFDPHPPHNHHVRPNKSNNRLLRRQTPQTIPPCLHHQVRNGFQSLPAPSNDHQSPAQSPSPHLPSRSHLHG